MPDPTESSANRNGRFINSLRYPNEPTEQFLIRREVLIALCVRDQVRVFFDLLEAGDPQTVTERDELLRLVAMADSYDPAAEADANTAQGSTLELDLGPMPDFESIVEKAREQDRLRLSGDIGTVMADIDSEYTMALIEALTQTQQ